MVGTEANAYWEERKNVLYYQVIRVLVDGLSKGAKSIIDVGSAGCPYVDWFPLIPTKTSIDLKRPYEAPGINSFTGDFLTWEPDQRYDIATCLQVMEHVPPVEPFAQKLLSIADVVVVSVPYKWEAGRTKSHVHDPVDEEKLMAWFGRRPNFEYVIREVVAPVDRIIHVYDNIVKEPWPAINRRAALLKKLVTA